MGAKKGKKGKKGKKKAGADTEPSPEEKNYILQAEIESLTQKLIAEQGRADVSKASENEKRHRELQLDRQLKDEEKRCRDIISDMTRQYKSRFEEMQSEITRLNDLSTAHKSEVEDLTKEYDDLIAEKNEIQKNKDDEINSFKKRIDEMSSDFAEMLRDTLAKMQDRIETASKEWDADNQVSLMERMQQNMLGDKAMWSINKSLVTFWMYSDSLSSLNFKFLSVLYH